MQLHDTTRPTFITLSYQAKDITGQRFGRLVAVGPVGRDKSNHVFWLCQCDCGNTSTVKAGNLRSQITQSCGCRQREMVSVLSKTHGMWNNPVYMIWIDIIRRCTNPKDASYKNYGARGISIYGPWRDSFSAFYEHVSQLPNFGAQGYSIDRIDNDGNYEPGNVRWATHSEQGRNKRNNRMLTFNGETKCVAEWSEALGISASVIFSRLYSGWTVERALTQALEVHRTTLQAQATLTAAEWAEKQRIEAALEREELALWERHGAAGWEWGWGR